MAEKLLTVGEVSKFLHVHPKTAYAWAKAGRLPSVSLGRGIRFERQAVGAYIENRRPRFVDPASLTTKVAIDLDNFDRLHLRLDPKGGRGVVDNKARRRWNYGFGSVYLRKTRGGADRWAIDYMAGGRRVREVVRDARTRSEAVVALQSEVAEAFSGRFNPVRKSGPMVFSKFAGIYLADYAKMNKRSWRADDYALRAQLIPYFGSATLSEITPHMIERYRAERLHTIRKSSVNREMALLKKMFNVAMDWGYAEENPVRKVKMFSERGNLKERILTDEEEVRLLGAASDRLRPILLALLHTGARRGEILGLTWADVDLEHRRLTFRKTKAGKVRSVSVNSTLLEVLRRQRETTMGDLVFPGPRGQQMVSIQRAYEDACEKAEIKGLRLHDLRHTFATRLMHLGVDIVTLQGILGHYSIEMTRRYLHSDEERQRDAVERLARVCHTETSSPVADAATVSYSTTSGRVN
jgi:excisionase family DNA binding protein